MYYLEIKTFGLVAEVDVNQVTLVGDETGEGLRTTRTVGEWIRPGTNEIAGRLQWPEGVREGGDSDAQIQVQFCLADPSGGFGPATVLAEFSWSAAESEAGTLPEMWCQKFEISDAPELRLWSEAQRIVELTSEDKNNIVALVESYRLALIEGRSEDAYQLSAIKYEDEAQANGNDLAESREVALEQLGWLDSQSGVESDPVCLDTAEFVLCGDQLVVQVARPLSPDAFEVRVDAMNASVRAYVARLGDAWAIVR